MPSPALRDRTALPYPEWARFLQSLDNRPGLGGSARPCIVDSWRRSRDAGVSPQRPSFHRVADADLAARLQANRQLLGVAVPKLLAISGPLGFPHVVYLTDADGIVLFAAPPDSLLIEEANLAPGNDWSERRMGTNGAGTALATGKAAAVLGCEHFCEAWQEFSCLAAPILDHGRPLGAIDLSLAVEDAKPLHFAQMARAAYDIEQALQRASVRLAG